MRTITITMSRRRPFMDSHEMKCCYVAFLNQMVQSRKCSWHVRSYSSRRLHDSASTLHVLQYISIRIHEYEYRWIAMMHTNPWQSTLYTLLLSFLSRLHIHTLCRMGSSSVESFPCFSYASIRSSFSVKYRKCSASFRCSHGIATCSWCWWPASGPSSVV